MSDGSGSQTELSLLIRTGPLRGRCIPLSRDIVLGRGDESSVRLPDAKLSRAHARIRHKRSKLVIEDLRSNNGTYVNDKRVRKRALLLGDRLKVGTTELVVVSRDGPVDLIDAAGDPTSEEPVVTLASLKPSEVEVMGTGEFMTSLAAVTEESEAQPLDATSVEILQNRTRNFAVLYNLARALQEPVYLDDLLQTAAGLIFKVIDAERCYILLMDPATGELEPRLARHRLEEIGDIPLQLSHTIIDRVIEGKDAIVSNNAVEDPQFVDRRHSILDFGIRSVLCVPILVGSDVIGVIQLDRVSVVGHFTRDDFELMTVIASLLGMRVRNTRLFDEQEQTIRQLRDAENALKASRFDLIWRLAKAAEFRDEETGHHIVRVAGICQAIAKALGADAEFIESLYVTAPLHDIGKLGIPDSILLKPGKLNEREWGVMRKHCAIGATILSEQSKAMSDYLVWRGLSPEQLAHRDDPTLSMACNIALTHHEKWDGSGYPAGLSGSDIPLEGRIVAISDVFDALLSERPYKRAFTLEKGLQIISEDVGRHFDPEVHSAFVGSLDEIEDILHRYSDRSN